MVLIPTFTQFVASAWQDRHPGDENVDAQWATYDQEVWLNVEAMKTDPVLAGQSSRLSELLADDVISTWLGAEWLERTFSAPSHRDPAVDRMASLLMAHRKCELGRRLYELQSFEWFTHFVKHLSTNDLAGAAFEADVLQTLMYTAGHVSRRVESGEKGQDFDISMTLPTGHHVPVEVKTKRDDTPLTEATVISTVRGAARQLPKGSTGWLFLLVPFAWVGPRLEEILPDSLGEGLRQTSRVSAVFVAVDKISLSRDLRSGAVHRHWHLHLEDNGDPALRQGALRRFQLLQAGLDNFAPRAPF